MRKAKVFNHDIFAGYLIENDNGSYSFIYDKDYIGDSISLSMPKKNKTRYDFQKFPPFFEGLLPEGVMLEALLKRAKIDRNDLFTQIITVGSDLVGSVTIEADE